MNRKYILSIVVVFLFLLPIFTVSAWFINGMNIFYRTPLATPIRNSNFPVAIDDSNGYVFWAQNQSNMYLYCTLTGMLGDCAISDNSITPANYTWENESTLTGNSPESVFSGFLDWWHMDNSTTNTTFNSSTVDGKDFTETSHFAQLSIVDGAVGKAVNFTNTSDDGINWGVASSMRIQNYNKVSGAGNFTMGAYVKLWNRLNNYGRILVYGSANGLNTEAHICDYASTGRWDFAGWANDIDSGITQQVGKWTCLVQTYNGTIVKWYVDNSSTTGVSGAITFNFGTPSEFGIGNALSTGISPDNVPTAVIDEVVFDNRTWTDSMVDDYCDNMKRLVAYGLEEIAPIDNYPTVTQNYPANNVWNTTSGNVYFNCSATDDLDVANITLYGNWTGTWMANETYNCAGVGNCSYKFTKTINDGLYDWNCLVLDNASHSSWGDNWTLMIDTTPPSILVDTITNGTTYSIMPNINGTSSDSVSGLANVTINETYWNALQNLMEMAFTTDDGSVGFFSMVNSTDWMNFSPHKFVYSSQFPNEVSLEFPNVLYNVSGDGDYDIFYMASMLGGGSQVWWMNTTDWVTFNHGTGQPLNNTAPSFPSYWHRALFAPFVIQKNATHWYLLADNLFDSGDYGDPIWNGLWSFAWADRSNTSSYSYLGRILNANISGFCGNFDAYGIIEIRGIKVGDVYHMFPSCMTGNFFSHDIQIGYFNTTNLEDNSTYQFWDDAVIHKNSGSWNTREISTPTIEYNSDDGRYYLYATAINNNVKAVIGGYYCNLSDFPCLSYGGSDTWTEIHGNPRITGSGSPPYETTANAYTPSMTQRIIDTMPVVYTSSPFNWTVSSNPAVGQLVQLKVSASDNAGNRNDYVTYFYYGNVISPPKQPLIDPSSITGQLVFTLGFGIMGLFAVLTLLGFGYIETTGKPDPETIAKIMIGVVIIILAIVAVWTGIVTPP